MSIDCNKIEELWNDNWPVPLIAEELGTTRFVIDAILKKMKLPKRDSGYVRTKGVQLRGKEEEPGSKTPYMYSICWTCEKACGGCSWSDCLELVNGCEYVMKYAKYNENKSEMPMIVSCPEYQKEQKKHYVFNDKYKSNAMDLLAAIVSTIFSDMKIEYIKLFKYGDRMSESEKNACSEKIRICKKRLLTDHILMLSGVTTEYMISLANRVEKEAMLEVQENRIRGRRKYKDIGEEQEENGT